MPAAISDAESNHHEEVAGLAYNEVADIFDVFAEELNTATGLVVDINYPDLMNVAESFAYDLARYRSFHEIKVPDRARRAAYMAKWIMRFRPVYLVGEVHELNESQKTRALILNEDFALYIASAFLDVDIEAELTDRMASILLYSFRYRSHSEDTFILYFAALCKI